ncbi:MAG: carbamoyltransferase, partial [Myxococcales bacterium]|nr:carbamoyltransferase [Myxococcales bacterium]
STFGHHRSHAASAFLPSPFERAAVVTLDGVGEWETTSIGLGEGTTLRTDEVLAFPHSLGLLYSVFTAWCGFRVNSGEYKLMGLAAFGEPSFERTIREHLLDLRDDGSFRVDARLLGILTGGPPSPALEALLGGPPRVPESPMSDRFRDIAASIQRVTEDVVERIARRAVERYGVRDLCLAGGVALNCVANGKLLERGVVDRIWVQPAAGDAGGALGAALCAEPVRVDLGACDLGPRLSEDVDVEGLVDALAGGEVVGLAQGGMELGPRALGFRSILADPRDPEMQDRVNRAVKKRESFRPFAPAVLEEHASACFDLSGTSPYMTLVGRASPGLPAVTHVDGTARVQTVSAARFPVFHRILTAWHARTGCPVLLNTSFNVRGEPIVCTADDAWRCFHSTGIDALAIDGAVHRKMR